MASIFNFREELLHIINNCITTFDSGQNDDLVIVQLERLHTLILRVAESGSVVDVLLEKIDEAMDLLTTEIDNPQERNNVGRPRLIIPISSVEYLLSIGFRAKEISKIFGVSKETIFRRMREQGMAVSNEKCCATQNLQWSIFLP